ncbi:MAG: GNAT family N-acetyltransferase [Bacilli bacterium]|nr:GNAT family N-acetyltransferase [Bacilli bacterium]
MGVLIKQVSNNKEKKQWVSFPSKLYKDNKYFVPFLRADEMDTFNPKVNPAYEFCETKLFLAYKDNKIVGRIAGLINHAYNEKWNKNAIRFTRFDFIDDYEVSKALLDEVIKWGKENNLTQIMGPIGFTDMDHEGMLVEGFEELNMSITFYNHPYYLTHLEKLGLVKDVDWVEYQIKVGKQNDEKFKKLTDYLMTRNGFELVEYTDRKVLAKDAQEAFKVIDVAFSVLHGSVPLTDAVINKALADYIPLVNLKYICSIKDKEGKIAGFAVLVPSIAKALKKSNGRMLPFGMFRMLKALKGKNDTLEMFFVAVLPEYQSKGLPAIMMYQLTRMCVENNVKICETGPELEQNEAVRSFWKNFDARQHRRRRCWKKEI